MATQADVRKIAKALPAVEEKRDRFAFCVRNKGKLKEFAWVWKERVDPARPRVPNFDVIAIRVPTLADRERLLAAHPRKYFTEPHYEGFPAVLVRVKAVTVRELTVLLRDGWACQAPADLRKRLE